MTPAAKESPQPKTSTRSPGRLHCVPTPRLAAGQTPAAAAAAFGHRHELGLRRRLRGSVELDAIGRAEDQRVQRYPVTEPVTGAGVGDDDARGAARGAHGGLVAGRHVDRVHVLQRGELLRVDGPHRLDARSQGGDGPLALIVQERHGPARGRVERGGAHVDPQVAQPCNRPAPDLIVPDRGDEERRSPARRASCTAATAPPPHGSSKGSRP